MKIKNYSLLEDKFIEEINSHAYLFEHDKTKAQILYLDNEDEIMTFSIGFKTPPKDSKGVSHILEHSVLSGSRKYHTKEPFMDMINSSMQTFLNAMTFPDKTIYPIATRNKKDFKNLMDVYLDAVFYPAIYEEEKIFKQEGIHIEMEDLDAPINYNGVVYNEMRGNYSDPEGQVLEVLAHQLHPSSSYAHDSGGNPYDIVDLTYEEVLDFHSRYYHPSNSYIFLNGKMDIESVMAYIDEEYLANFDYQDPKSQIDLGQRFDKPRYVKVDYSIGQEEDTKNKAYLVYGVELGQSSSVEDDMLSSIISEIVMDAESSVLREELLKSSIGEDYYSYSSSSLPIDLYLVAKNADEDSMDDYIEIIETNLKKAVKEGIDPDLIDGAINKREFALKDMGIHRGVYLNIMSLKSWLYGASPIEGLSFKDSLDKIKEKSHDGYIEDFIEEKILNNPQKIKLIASPKPGMMRAKDQELRDDLDQLKETMSKNEQEKLVKETKELFAYQLEDDSEEDKKTIPQLDLEDIDPGVASLDVKIDEENYPKIFVDEYTNGVYYMTARFNIKGLTEEELHYAALVTDLLTMLDTENYSYKDLDSQIDIHTGGISTFTSTASNTRTEDYYISSAISARSIPEKIDKTHELLDEIILKTKFDNSGRIKELITMRRGAYESSIEQSGHRNVVSQIQAKLREEGYYGNLLGGNEYYFFLKDLEKNFDQKSQEIIAKLDQVYKKIFNQDLIISVAGKKEWYDKAVAYFDQLRNKLSSYKELLGPKDLDKSSLALKNSSNVVYVGQGFDYKELGLDYHGSMAVLAKILSGAYLHPNIRAKGGAYGSGISISTRGLVTMYSYRDPNLDQTYKVYSGLGSFIKELDLTDRELTNYIISTMNSFDPPMTPSSYASLALTRYMSDIRTEDIEKYKNQALDTSLEDLQAYGPIFEKGQEERVYVTLGSRDIIDQAETNFEKEIDLNI